MRLCASIEINMKNEIVVYWLLIHFEVILQIEWFILQKKLDRVEWCRYYFDFFTYNYRDATKVELNQYSKEFSIIDIYDKLEINMSKPLYY